MFYKVKKHNTRILDSAGENNVANVNQRVIGINQVCSLLLHLVCSSKINIVLVNVSLWGIIKGVLFTNVSGELCDCISIICMCERDLWVCTGISRSLFRLYSVS